MRETNFTQCALSYVPLSESLIRQYGFSGQPQLIPPNRFTQITLAGCKALCGNGTDYYPWVQSSDAV